MRISDWSSDVCSSDLRLRPGLHRLEASSPRLARFSNVRRPCIRHLQKSDFSSNGQINGELMSDSEKDAAQAEQEALEYVNAKIGRATCRERVCQYVKISVVAVRVKKKKNKKKN